MSFYFSLSRQTHWLMIGSRIMPVLYQTMLNSVPVGVAMQGGLTVKISSENSKQ
jgi:hypothetical protein